MRYKIGQFRKPQSDTYYTDITNQIDQGYQETSPEIDQESESIFYDPCGNLSNILLTSQNYYYLRFKVKRRTDSIQNFYLKLCNVVNGVQDQEQQQTVQEFSVEKGTDYAYFQAIIAPNATYNQILWQLRRTSLDYKESDIEEEGHSGRIMEIQIQNFSIIENIINHLGNSSLKSLTKIGIQGPPSLLMCINGEQIRIGKSGIYEINNGIIISFIGFIPKESQYFIMDFEYAEQEEDD